MRFLMTLALAGIFAAPAASAAQQVLSTAMDCGAQGTPASGETANLHGNWDLLMDVGGTPSFGLMSIGLIDGAYGGSLTPARTAPVVLRRIVLNGNDIHLSPPQAGAMSCSTAGFGGGDRMCGW